MCRIYKLKNLAGDVAQYPPNLSRIVCNANDDDKQKSVMAIARTQY